MLIYHIVLPDKWAEFDSGLYRHASLATEGFIHCSFEEQLPGVIERYNAKYDWDYQVGEYGELAVVEPARVMAWRSGGWAGRDGFQATGRWDFDLSG